MGYFIAAQSKKRVIIDPRKQIHTSEPFPVNEDIYELLNERDEVILRPGIEGTEGILDPVAHDVLDWSESHPEEKICLFIDEASMSGVDQKPQDAYPHFNYLLRSAGEDNLNVVITCHRIIETHPAIRSIAHYFCIFRTTHPRDLDAIEEKAGPEVAEESARLAPRTAIIWNDNVAVARTEPNARKWFIDISKPRVENASRA